MLIYAKFSKNIKNQKKRPFLLQFLMDAIFYLDLIEFSGIHRISTQNFKINFHKEAYFHVLEEHNVIDVLVLP